MPRKTVFPDLDQFRPPGFDLERYNQELKPRTPEQWYQAMHRRWKTWWILENRSRKYRFRPDAERRLDPILQRLFPHHEVVGELGQGPDWIEENRTNYVKDMGTETALTLFNLMRSHPKIAQTIEQSRPGTAVSWLGALGALTFEQLQATVVSLLNDIRQHNVAEPKNRESILDTSDDVSFSIPLEVNLHAPDMELIAAFTRWLESAREIHGVPEPRPEVLNKAIKNPVITQAMLHDWQRDRILPFLDLYLWNLWQNPPPCEGLWKSTTPGRFFYKGATWTFTTETWMKLIEWDDARTFRRDIIGKSLRLLDRQVIDLLGAFARRCSEATVSKD